MTWTSFNAQYPPGGWTRNMHVSERKRRITAPNFRDLDSGCSDIFMLFFFANLECQFPQFGGY